MSSVVRKVRRIEPVQYHTLSELTAANLRDSIIRGHIKPGAKITEAELAETLDVSRNVVREAVMILISEGLMIKERNKFTKVVEFTKNDIVDIFDLRIAVEQAAVKRCMNNPDFCDMLEVYSEKIESNMNGQSKDYADLMSADIEFHNYIIVSSGNRRLLDTWNRFIGPMKMLLYRHMNDVQAMKSSHRNLIQVIHSGDYQQVCAAFEQHIDDTKYELLRSSL